MPLTAKRTVTVDEAAAILGVSRRTIYYRITDGRLQVEASPRGWRIVTEGLHQDQRRQRMKDERTKGDGSDMQDPANATKAETDSNVASNQADGHAKDEHEPPADAGDETHGSER